ncbi:MAG TPA: class I SAM-dependent methyltransferase [Verrucomicrobiae bacterium]|nr:class I SAM-dependent methyltransferase [Verrucomicrobiae bacterium]
MTGARLPYPGRRGADYDAAFAARAAAGADVHGEAALIALLAPATVLDAGCGTGRVAAELDRRGIVVVGVDRDPLMLQRARETAPHLPFILGDLATLTVSDVPPKRPAEAPADGCAPRLFACVVCAGNVLLFVDPGSEAAVVANLARHLAPGGRLVAGFQLVAAGLDCARYDAICRAAGLELEQRFATWERDPFAPGSDYQVSIHRRAA